MTTDDKASKPSAANNNNPSLPATKSQLSGASRPATFRPQSYRHRNPNRDRDRSLCCTLCTYLCLLLLFLVVLVGVAATVFYLLFHPQPPSFILTSLNISSSSSSTLNFDLTLSAANPNSKIVFSYQPTSVSILAGADDASVAGGTLSAFDQGERNTTVLMASVGSSETTTELRNDAVVAEVKKGVLPVKVKMVTKVEAKMWVLKTPPVGITVLCDDASVAVPAAPKKTAVAEDTAADTAKSECEVDMMRFKVWKWNV